VLLEFEKKHKIVNRQQKFADKKAALWITIIGDPRKKDQITSELNNSLELMLNSKPSLSVDVIPSNEYVGERFKMETELLNTKFVPFLNQAAPVQSTLIPQQISKPSFIKSREIINNTISEAIDWLNGKSTGPECYAWSYNIGSSWAELVIWRISDTPLDKGEKELIASYIKKLTSASVRVSENRLPKTIFSTSKPASENKIKSMTEKLVKRIPKDKWIGADIFMKDPKKVAAGKSPKAYKQTNNALLKLLNNKIPSDRIKIHSDSDKWAISLFVISKNEALMNN